MKKNNKTILESIDMQIDEAILVLAKVEALKKEAERLLKPSNMLVVQVQNEAYKEYMCELRTRIIKTINLLYKFKESMNKETKKPATLDDIFTDLDVAMLSDADREFLKTNGIKF